MANEKVYAQGLFGDVRQFQNGGEIYALSIHKENFINWLNEQEASEKGYVKIDVVKQMSDPTKLSASLNTYQPKAKVEDGSNDLPF